MQHFWSPGKIITFQASKMKTVEFADCSTSDGAASSVAGLFAL